MSACCWEYSITAHSQHSVNQAVLNQNLSVNYSLVLQQNVLFLKSCALRYGYSSLGFKVTTPPPPPPGKAHYRFCYKGFKTPPKKNRTLHEIYSDLITIDLKGLIFAIIIMGGDDVDLCSWELPLEGDLLSGRGLSYKAVNVGFSHSRPDVPLYLKD